MARSLCLTERATAGGHRMKDAGRVSWTRRFADRSASLAGDGAQAQLLCNAFGEVAHEWAEYDARAPSPLASGLAPDGSPVELSVRVAIGTREVHLRFIAQPGRPDVPLHSDTPFLRGRAIEFAGKWAGAAGAAAASAVLSLFPRDPPPIDRGNFYLWLGIDLRSGAAPLAKLYLNPWASLEEFQGVALLESVLRMSSMGSALPALERLLATRVSPLVHIIGLNLSSAGIESVKLYFVLSRARLADLARVTASFEDPQGGSDMTPTLFRTAPASRREGQVHGTLLWRRGRSEPAFRASLYCAHWFSSDDDVLRAASAVVGARHTWAPGRPCTQRWFTFLAVDSAGLTLYSRV